MSTKLKTLSIVFCLSWIVLSACTASKKATATATPGSSIANPATVNCELKGYRSQIRTTADGSQYGICIFPDGSACEEWAFYRNECVPVPGTGSSTLANPASVNCLQKGGKLTTVTASDGSQYGVCTFADGSTCEEWAFLRGECAPQSAPAATPGSSQIANPASTYCVQKGGKVEIRTAADGSQSGVCVFSDGSECDEWAFFKGECAPGANKP